MLGEIFEELMEIILDGALEGSENQKIPRPVRIILKVLVILVYSAIILLFAVMGIGALRSGETGMGIFLLVLGVLLTAVVYFKVIKRIER